MHSKHPHACAENQGQERGGEREADKKEASESQG